jgi:hypothetical protein
LGQEQAVPDDAGHFIEYDAELRYIHAERPWRVDDGIAVKRERG